MQVRGYKVPNRQNSKSRNLTHERHHAIVLRTPAESRFLLAVLGTKNKVLKWVTM